MKNYEIIIAPSISLPDTYYIFRNDGTEIEVNTQQMTTTAQLLEMEIHYFTFYFPNLSLSHLSILKKNYNNNQYQNTTYASNTI